MQPHCIYSSWLWSCSQRIYCRIFTHHPHVSTLCLPNITTHMWWDLPGLPFRICILQVIKDWRWECPGKETTQYTLEDQRVKCVPFSIGPGRTLYVCTYVCVCVHMYNFSLYEQLHSQELQWDCMSTSSHFKSEEPKPNFYSGSSYGAREHCYMQAPHTCTRQCIHRHAHITLTHTHTCIHWHVTHTHTQGERSHTGLMY